MKISRKITSQKQKEALNVYGVYSSSKGPVFCVSPKNYEGLLVLGAEDIDIVDPVFDLDVIYYRFPNGNFGLFYRPLIEENLLDDLYELDAAAYQKFVAYLGHEP